MHNFYVPGRSTRDLGRNTWNNDFCAERFSRPMQSGPHGKADHCVGRVIILSFFFHVQLALAFHMTHMTAHTRAMSDPPHDTSFFLRSCPSSLWKLIFLVQKFIRNVCWNLLWCARYVVMPRFCRGSSNLLSDFDVEFVGRDPQRRTNLLRGDQAERPVAREIRMGTRFFLVTLNIDDRNEDDTDDDDDTLLIFSQLIESGTSAKPRQPQQGHTSKKQQPGFLTTHSA